VTLSGVGVHSDHCSVQTRDVTTEYKAVSLEQDLKHATCAATWYSLVKLRYLLGTKR